MLHTPALQEIRQICTQTFKKIHVASEGWLCRLRQNCRPHTGYALNLGKGCQF